MKFARCICLTSTGAAALAPLILAQSVPSVSKSGTRAAPQFEVASVKRNQQKTVFMGVRQWSHGRVVTDNTPLTFLIGLAYKRREGWFEIAGARGWMDSDGYDIAAKSSGDSTDEQMYAMLQTLLRDRFQLKLRRETRELPVYNLVTAKGGLNLRNAKRENC